MDIKINDLSLSEKELEATLVFDEFKVQLEQEVIKRIKKVEVPGFRKGKVPLPIIKKMYGDSFDYEASEKIANSKFWDISKEKKLEPLGQPILSDIKLNPGKDLYFKVKYEVYPKLTVKDYKSINIEIPDFKVTDEDIENEILHIKKSNSTREKAEKIEDNNFIIDVEVQRQNEDGNIFEGSQKEKLQIDLSNENVQKEMVSNAMNKKIGDRFKFSFKDERKIKDKKGEEKVHVDNYLYEAEILTINKNILPELNEELIKKVTNDKFSKEEELRTEIKNNITSFYKQQEDEFFQTTLISKILENNEFIPPKTMVENFLQNLVNNEEERIKKEKKGIFNRNETEKRLEKTAENQVKWYIIKNEIEKLEKIEVSEDDIKKLAEVDAKKTGITVDKLLNYYKSSNYAEKVKTDKLFELLKESTKIKRVDPKKMLNNDSKGSK